MSIIYDPNSEIRGRGPYFDNKSERSYRRIYGGIAWPGERPGFIAIVGEQFSYEQPYHTYLIQEYEGDSAGELIRKCIELKSQCHVECFYGMTKDKANMYFLSQTNQQATKDKKPSLQILSAPFSDSGNISYHINMLLERLSINNKTLHLTVQSKLPGYLQEIQSTQVHNAKANEYPAIAALGYAITALLVYGPKLKGKISKGEKANKEWDPLSA